MQNKRLLPYRASAWAGREMWEVLKAVQNTHQNDAERVRIIANSLERAYLMGEAMAEETAFKWGLLIGAASGAVIMSGMMWLVSLL